MIAGGRADRRAATVAARLPARCRWALALAMLGLAGPAGAACELVLLAHRSGAELQRLPLDARAPQVQIAFVHSVLGTPVVDHYRFTPQARLVQEQFDGQGYGLPHAAGPGEQLQRDGTGWRLLLSRPVHPLVVRPLPQLRMRLLLGGREWPLADFSPQQAIELQAQGCAAAPDS